MNKVVIVPQYDKRVYQTIRSIYSCGFSLWELYYHYTLYVLEKNNGSRTRTAIETDVCIRTLRNMLRKMKASGYPIATDKDGRTKGNSKKRRTRAQMEIAKNDPTFQRGNGRRGGV